MDLMDLKAMIGRALGAEPTKREEFDDNPDKPIPVPNRAVNRALKGRHYNPLRDRQYHRPRSRTGQPDWFRSMKFRSRIKSFLGAVPVSDLDLPESTKTALGERYKSVWDLSQTSYTDLLKVKGIGPSAAKKIRAELVRRSVPVSWKAE